MELHRDHHSDNNTSADVEMVTLYRSRGLVDGGLEADLHGILEKPIPGSSSHLLPEQDQHAE